MLHAKYSFTSRAIVAKFTNTRFFEVKIHFFLKKFAYLHFL